MKNLITCVELQQRNWRWSVCGTGVNRVSCCPRCSLCLWRHQTSCIDPIFHFLWTQTEELTGRFVLSPESGDPVIWILGQYCHKLFFWVATAHLLDCAVGVVITVGSMNRKWNMGLRSIPSSGSCCHSHSLGHEVEEVRAFNQYFFPTRHQEGIIAMDTGVAREPSSLPNGYSCTRNLIMLVVVGSET